MSRLPFAPTDTCRACGADARRDHYRFSVAESVARDTLYTGNLCEQCYEELVAVIEGKSGESS